MTRENFRNEIARLALVFKEDLSGKPGQLRIDEYFRVCGHAQPGDLKQAVDKIIETERWFPPPAVLLHYVQDAATLRRQRTSALPPPKPAPLTPEEIDIALRGCAPAFRNVLSRVLNRSGEDEIDSQNH